MTAIDISNILVNAGPFGIASIFIWLFMDERKANRALNDKWADALTSMTSAMNSNSASSEALAKEIERGNAEARRNV